MGESARHSATGVSLVAVRGANDILSEYRGTAIGDLLAYHNLGATHRGYGKPELLIGMCMDYRVQLRIPPDFAFVLRCAGANLGLLEFDVSFAIAVGGVRSVCLIGHEACRMSDVASKREAFVAGLIDSAGWNRRQAEEYFDANSSRYEIGDVADFTWLEAQRLRRAYAGITVAPLVYAVDDRNLSQVTDSRPLVATDHATVHATVEAESEDKRR